MHQTLLASVAVVSLCVLSVRIPLVMHASNCHPTIAPTASTGQQRIYGWVLRDLRYSSMVRYAKFVAHQPSLAQDR